GDAAGLVDADIAEEAGNTGRRGDGLLGREGQRKTKARRIEAHAMIVVGFLVARQIALQVEHAGGSERPYVVDTRAFCDAVLIGAGEGVAEIVVAEFVLVIPADSGERLVEVVPGVVAAR